MSEVPRQIVVIVDRRESMQVIAVGMQGPTGPAGSAGNFIDAEIPFGVIDGANKHFTLTQPPTPALSLILVKNGTLQTAGVDYVLAGAAIDYVLAMEVGDAHVCWYRF